MSELKHYWDNLSPDTDSVSADYSLDKVLTKINRKRTAKLLSAALAACAILLAAGLFLYVPAQDPQMLQCYTPYGQKQTVELPDGTTVEMNSGSTLIYPERFTSNSRNVIFSGEGIFSVAKDKRHPFVVKTTSFEVEVLGTVFNLNAFPEDRNSSVVLAEGSVMIRQNDSESTLKPGQKAEIQRDGSISITNVTSSDYMAWNKGGFILQGADMDEIVRMIEHTYGLEVQCSYSEKFEKTRITARSETNRSVEEFLDLMTELIPGMKYRITDNTIYIY